MDDLVMTDEVEDCNTCPFSFRGYDGRAPIWYCTHPLNEDGKRELPYKTLVEGACPEWCRLIDVSVLVKKKTNMEPDFK